MGYISDKYLKDKPAYYFLFQIAISIVLIFFFLYFFQTQCLNAYSDGFDNCKAQLGKSEQFNITFYPNGSIEHITVTDPAYELPFNPDMDNP